MTSASLDFFAVIYVTRDSRESIFIYDSIHEVREVAHIAYLYRFQFTDEIIFQIGPQ